jgi:serine/threonine protein kinase
MWWKLCVYFCFIHALLNPIVDESNGLDWNTRYKIIKGSWEGLKHLHQGLEEPIYHLDLKPDNILLDNNMLPKLADFGMSKIFKDQQTMTMHSPIGTL